MIEIFNLLSLICLTHLLPFFIYKRSSPPSLLVHVIIWCKMKRVSVSEACRRWISWIQACLGTFSRIEVINSTNIRCFCCTSASHTSPVHESKTQAKDGLSSVSYSITVWINQITRLPKTHTYHSPFSLRIQNSSDPRRWDKSVQSKL
jgi:hypothetical protein